MLSFTVHRPWFTVHFALFATLALFCTPVLAECAPASLPDTRTLKRGVNLSEWWQESSRKAPALEEIRELKRIGMDFVRLPIALRYLEENDAKTRAKDLARLRCDLVALLAGGLNVVLDLHTTGKFDHALENAPPDKALARLAGLWKRVAPALEGLGAEQHILFGLLNEPEFEKNGDWWRLQGELVENLRADFPNTRFIASASPKSVLWNLAKFDPYEDRDVLYDFHFYTPMLFTHYGAPWITGAPRHRKTGGVSYPSAAPAEDQEEDIREYNENGWNREKLAVELNKIIAWKKKHKVPVVCLEFGVYRPLVDAASRRRWLSDMRGLLEAAGIPWALWEYRGTFGLMTPDAGPDEEIVKALGLNHNPGNHAP